MTQLTSSTRRGRSRNGLVRVYLYRACVQGVFVAVFFFCPFQNSVKIGKTNSPEFAVFRFLPPIFMRLCPKRRTCIKINHLRNARILRFFTSLNFGPHVPSPSSHISNRKSLNWIDLRHFFDFFSEAILKLNA